MKLKIPTMLFWALVLGVGGPGEASGVPSSRRSRAAVARVAPKLDRALVKKGLTRGSPIFIRIFKQERTLELFVRKSGRYVRFKAYPICSFSGALGPKQKEGDMQAPEGFYKVSARSMNPRSSYHLSFNLGYPNAFDRAHKRTGSFLMVHGSCVSIGCYAMTDPGIEEIWTLATAALAGGQRAFEVHIFPFRMTEANMKAHEGSRWIGFWRDLKAVHDRFEATKKTPRVRVEKRRYVLRKRR